MLSGHAIKYTQKCFKEAEKGFGRLKSQIEENMSRICGDERALMELCYGTLPSSDIGSVDFDTLRSYASHAIMLYNKYEHVRNLSEDIFLHFVFYPRINSENLVDCRSFFYNQLKDVLDIPDASERVLAVNRWCAGHVTYQASDDRTESPMAAYYSGYGRCGEESVFTVTALRSIGIPARQVYVPWWSHCDDNHAWVEVYVDGKWRFLGACEPEPVLDRGWFTAAASRAPLVHSRTFFDYGMKDEEIIGNQGICLLYNQTSRYAETGAASIAVRHKDGRPAEGARVSFQVINMASLVQIAEVVTDSCGRASLNMGCGSVHAEVFLDGMYGEADLIVKPGTTTERIITLSNELPSNQISDLDFIAPAAGSKNMPILTDAQQREKRSIIAQAKEKRDKKLQSYWNEEYDRYPQDVKEMFHLAGGNAEEIRAFYDEKPEDLKMLATLLLKALSKKDYKDLKAEMLNKHFCGALCLDIKHDEMFVSYVMCPRIGYEILEDWRDTINKAFTDEQKKLFYREPSCLMEYIKEHFREGEGKYYDTLTMTPSAVMALGIGDEKARNVLFVAIMRTIGVPSRLSPYDGRAEYFRDGRFHRAENQHKRNYVIKLIPQEGKRLVYCSNFTLSKWKERGYELLKYTGESLDNAYKIPVCAGHYRLITSNRLPNGNQLVRITHFTLDDKREGTGKHPKWMFSPYGEAVECNSNYVAKAGTEVSTYGDSVEYDDKCGILHGSQTSLHGNEHKYMDNRRGGTLCPPEETPIVKIPIILRLAKIEDMLENNPLHPFELKDEKGNIIIQNNRRIIAFLDLGTEPTEHILNELMECQEALGKEMFRGLHVILVLRSPSEKNNPTLSKVINKIPQIMLAYDDFDNNPETLARVMYIEPGIWPLVLLLDSRGYGRYGNCGYSVGLIELILKLSRLLV